MNLVKKLLIAGGVLILLLALIFYLTHTSVEQELTEQDLELRAELNQGTAEVVKQGMFDPDAEDSDRLHRGWGSVQVLMQDGQHRLVFGEDFRVTNGPDYHLYLVTERGLQTEARFNEIKEQQFDIASVKQFEGFQTFDIPETINLDQIQGVVIWCELFGEFITYADLA